jgi:tRNA G10  N-methylase Trm11
LSTKAALHADCRQLPYRDESMDVVVLDPPYVRSAHPRMVFNYRYNGLNVSAGIDIDEIRDLYRAAMIEARRVLKPRGRLFVKCMDQVVDREECWQHIEVYQHAVADLGMFGRDLFILVPTAPPASKRWAKQKHARKSHSFLWVFERRAKEKA